MIRNQAFLAAMGLAFLTSGGLQAEECPPLNTGNIGEAACASKSSPFLTAPLAAVEFAATTPCPVALGFKKKLQTIFKGKKDYPATDTKVISNGEALCTYTLTDDWKKAIKSQESTLVFTVEFPTREHANYWSAPLIGSKCPALDGSEVDNILHGQINVETKSSNLAYIFKVRKYKQNTFKNPFSSPDLKELQGTATINKPYEVKCEYTYHSGSEETKIELVGKQRL